MTLSALDLALYAAALFALFLTPGPVWVAMLARTLSGGFHGAWPLALGVLVGDVLWALLAILFYAGMLPGFFDLAALTRWDIAAICGLSAAVPLIGNLILAGMVGQMRRLLASPAAVRRTNTTAGVLLIAVGLAIPVL